MVEVPLGRASLPRDQGQAGGTSQQHPVQLPLGLPTQARNQVQGAVNQVLSSLAGEAGYVLRAAKPNKLFT